MKTIIITFEDNETAATVIEYKNYEQKKFLIEHYLKVKNTVYMTDIDGFCYLQHKK